MSVTWTAQHPSAAVEPPIHGAPVSEADLAPLPGPARRYLRAMGVVGRPRDTSFQLAWKGRFRTGVGSPWLRCEAWQRNTVGPISREFRMRLWAAGILPVHGRDSYEDGHGRMLIRPLNLFTTARAIGHEFDIGELVTWLDDAILFAPSMLLTPGVTWLEADATSFDLDVVDRGLRVHGRVRLDDRGLPLYFVTHDRWCANPVDRGRLIRAQWRTPVDEWAETGGRMTPVRGRAIWNLPQGEFPYADLRVVPESLAWSAALPDRGKER